MTSKPKSAPPAAAPAKDSRSRRPGEPAKTGLTKTGPAKTSRRAAGPTAGKASASSVAAEKARTAWAAKASATPSPRPPRRGSDATRAPAASRSRSRGRKRPPATIFRTTGAGAALRDLGRSLRKQTPRVSHAGFVPAADRPDPVDLIAATNRNRVPELVPIRWGRMLDSPFTFYRGAPAMLAWDLSHTPTTGVNTQACGDAHLLNFGLFATPERRLTFDVNDFDETLPAPWEWDLKRLTASAVVAARAVGLTDQDGAAAARRAAEVYQLSMAGFAQMSTLDLWYTKIDVDDIMGLLQPRDRKRANKSVERARRHTSLQAMEKLTAVDEHGERHIVDQPPTLLRLPTDGHERLLTNVFTRYLGTLSHDRQYLLGQYEFADFALKVVGVGSVGTRCFIALLTSRVDNSPLFLQVKQAEASVLEPFVGPSDHASHGERVVCGQKLMQSASDIFLGWTTYNRSHFYLRQLRDMKGSADIAAMRGSELAEYLALCAVALARAHARTVPPELLTGYLGTGEVFADAITRFSVDYADQNERDYESLVAAVKSGRIEAQTGV